MKMKPLFLCSLIFLSLQHFSLLSLSTGSPSSSSSKDAQQLLSFKSTISTSNPATKTLFANWVYNQDPCNFTGVFCKDSSHVSSLDLSNTPLEIEFHSVSSYLMNLEHLESFSLSNTNLSGTISMVGFANIKCSSLLYSIDLSNNKLSGSVSDLSTFTVSCPALKFINISSNSLDYVPKTNGDSAGFLLNNIETLDLSFNRISGAYAVGLIVSNGCDKLKNLRLRSNNVIGNIPVSNCKSLEYLDLSFNNFSTNFPLLGDACLTLQHLDLASNKFSGDIGKSSLSGCGKLTFLNISSNYFTGEIPSIAIGKLEYLYLAGNDFTGSIPTQYFSGGTNLLELDLSRNKFSGMIPISLGSCIALELIDFSSNNLSGDLPLQMFVKMSNLRKLILAFNNFSGPLSDSISELTSLETFDVSSNNISGLIPSVICQSQNQRDSLKELYLPNNMFTGHIPESLSNCSELVTLDLSFNYLIGTIPKTLGSLSKLRDLIMWLNQLEGEIPEELMYIEALENLILDFNDLTGNIPSGLSKCTNLNWISLSNNRLSGEIPAWIGTLPYLAILKLSNNSFYGRIPPELGDCKSLIWVDLNTNFLNGTIPPSLFKQAGNIAVNLVKGKRYAYIKGDGSDKCHGAGNLLEFAGIRQEQLIRISVRNPCNFTRVYGGNTEPTFNHNGSMIFLDLSYNALSGSIPKELGVMYYLYIMNLGHNNLSGSIPQELGSLKNLNILDLSNNRLDGSIPQSLTGLTLLIEINLANNNLSGQIPESGQFETLPAFGFANNSGLCGLPLHACGSGSTSNGNGLHQKARHGPTSLVGSVAMGLLFSLFCIFGFIIVAVEIKKRRKKKDSTLDVYIDSRSQSGTANNTNNWKLTGVREALSINLSTFEKPLQKLTFADLLEATNGFHDGSLIGSGGFGDVYKAELKDGSVVAIKKLIHVSGQGDREFIAEMETIGKVKHRNLVPLLGYCKVGEERLLVYEYMRFGSLEDVLHDRKKNGIKLNWAARRKVALGSARGLAFLHHNCIPHIIHRDMKSSNVLLDENLEARVSDFGMARHMNAMDTHLSVSTLAGTPGYVPPEYYQSFRCSTKGDVYSYGVVLLELLTGRQPTDSADFGDNNLVGWVKQHAKLKITDVFDPVLLKEDPGLEIELLQHLKVACACLDDRPWRRPTMIQVMTMFKEIQAGSGTIDSTASTTVADDESFTNEMVEMTIQEGSELSNRH